ncbi:porin [Variovorax paradoxus]|uniref:porin n=1 Tax=Variovorax paradoxus TaxID=34073 RepID=UPI003ECD56B9
MKNCLSSIVGAAALALVASGAQGQSIIYGLVDACVARSNIDGAHSTRVGSGCQSGSRLGFRGSENLGGGLTAGFQLENGFNVDDGSFGQGGRMFGRKAVLSLSSATFGTIELGRDYAPTFYALAPIDPTAFGIGTVSSTMWTGSNPTTVARNDNAVNYISPALGPVIVRVQYSFGEQPAPASSGARSTLGFNMIYRSGAWLASLAHARHANATDSAHDRASTAGLSYTIGGLILSGAFQAGRWEGSRTVAAPSSTTSIFSRHYRSYMIGASYQVLPLLRALVSIKRYDDRTARDFDAHQVTATAIYALSKRTDLYASYSWLKNVAGSSYDISDATTRYSGVHAGANTSLIAMGVRHVF